MDADSPEWKCPGGSWISPARGMREAEWLEVLMWPSWITQSPCLPLFVFSRTRICWTQAPKSWRKKTKQQKKPLTLYFPDFRCRFVNKMCTSIKERPTVGSLYMYLSSEEPGSSVILEMSFLKHTYTSKMYSYKLYIVPIHSDLVWQPKLCLDSFTDAFIKWR